MTKEGRVSQRYSQHGIQKNDICIINEATSYPAVTVWGTLDFSYPSPSLATPRTLGIDKGTTCSPFTAHQCMKHSLLTNLQPKPMDKLGLNSQHILYTQFSRNRSVEAWTGSEKVDIRRANRTVSINGRMVKHMVV